MAARDEISAAVIVVVLAAILPIEPARAYRPFDGTGGSVSGIVSEQ